MITAQIHPTNKAVGRQDQSHDLNSHRGEVKTDRSQRGEVQVRRDTKHDATCRDVATMTGRK